MIILDLNGSYRADLESNLLAVGNNITLFLDIRDWLCRDT